MESSACRRGASDADLSPRAYSATAECEPVMVKEEPDCGVCGVSEAALAEGLYAGHEVKGEIVIGPELIEQQDIAFSMQSTLRKAEEDACEVKPAGEAGPATESTRAQSDLNTREHTHTGKKPHNCDICHKQFTKRIQLTNHKRIHTGGKHSCDICSKRFTLRSNLTVHVRSHTGETPFSCGVCGKQFTQKPNLIKHARIHTGEKPYSCDICKKRFTEKSTLTSHIRIHMGEKPHSCDICSKRFTLRSHLTVHVRSHTGETPFSCGVCGKQFAQKPNLIKHARIHTDKKDRLH
ncbi:uncharacterized protein isoform X5 [Choristoneura fumiferana]|uniref:uncharacterized protein isoform X5 n=1 Tax=Choristoneura fumiferana TaxID=7141 RepID=UPI003D15EFE8